MGVFTQGQVAQLMKHARLTEASAKSMLGGLEHDEAVLIQILNKVEEHLVNLHSWADMKYKDRVKIDELGREGQRLILLAKAMVSKDEQKIANEFALIKSLFSDYVRSVRGS